MSFTIDVQRMHDSIFRLPEQLERAWGQGRTLRIPTSYRSVEHVVVAGMGGSGLAGHIVQSSFADSLAAPLFVLNGDRLPAFVNAKTLVIVVSFSGQTEESLSVYREARARRSKRAAITSGGTLGRYAKEDGVPLYRFDPVANPSGRPRVGGGYLLGGLLSILGGAGILAIGKQEMERALARCKMSAVGLSQATPLAKNPAKQLARELVGRLPVLIGSLEYSGNLHAWANSLNETAKTFSAYFTLPELNHHLLEGLSHPREAKRLLRFVGVRPAGGRLERRYELTRRIALKHGLRWIESPLSSSTKLAAVFELLLLGNFVAYYLALENQENPSPNPWVDYFKRQLAKGR